MRDPQPHQLFRAEALAARERAATAGPEGLELHQGRTRRLVYGFFAVLAVLFVLSLTVRVDETAEGTWAATGPDSAEIRLAPATLARLKPGQRVELSGAGETVIDAAALKAAAAIRAGDAVVSVALPADTSARAGSGRAVVILARRSLAHEFASVMRGGNG